MHRVRAFEGRIDYNPGEEQVRGEADGGQEYRDHETVQSEHASEDQEISDEEGCSASDSEGHEQESYANDEYPEGIEHISVEAGGNSTIADEDHLESGENGHGKDKY